MGILQGWKYYGGIIAMTLRIDWDYIMGILMKADPIPRSKKNMEDCSARSLRIS
jgi:hypothetical protein